MGNFNFRVAAGDCSVHGTNNPVKMEFDVRPLLVAKDYDGNSTPGKILLITDILVRSKKQFVTSIFGLTQQLAVLEFVPTDSASKRHFMTDKAAGDRVAIGLGVPLSNNILIRAQGPWQGFAWQSGGRLSLLLR